MGWLEGWLTGFSQRHQEQEAENWALAQQASQREGDVFKMLLQSKDPAIRGMAATGLIQQTLPRRRKSGLAGWMGEMETSPIYPQIMKYISTPQLQGYEDIPGTGSTTTAEQAGYKPSLPQAQPSPPGMSINKTTTPGTPGPALQLPAPPSPRVPAPRGGPTPPLAVPPPPPSLQGGWPIQTPEGTAIEEQLNPNEFRDERGAHWAMGPNQTPIKIAEPPPKPLDITGLQASLAGPGTAPGPMGAVPPAPLTIPPKQQGVYGLPSVFPTAEEQQAGQSAAVIRGQIEALAETYQTAYGWPRQQALQRAAQQIELERMRSMGAMMPRLVKGTVDENGVRVSATGIWNPFTQQVTRLDTREVDPTFREENPLNYGALNNLLGVGAGLDMRALSPEDARQVASLGLGYTQQQAYRRGVGRAAAPLSEAQSITTMRELAPDAPINQILAGAQWLQNMDTGLRQDPNVTLNAQQPAGPTQIPPDLQKLFAGTRLQNRPLPPDVAGEIAKSQQLDTMIGNVLHEMETAKDEKGRLLKDVNDEEGGLRFAEKYRQGYYTDLSHLLSLVDLSGLTGASRQTLTQGSSRAMAQFDLRRQHVPRLPTGQQVEAYVTGRGLLGGPLAARAVGKIYRLSEEEGGWDTPASMYSKLQLLYNVNRLAARLAIQDGIFPRELVNSGMWGLSGQDLIGSAENKPVVQ
ncbi:MAG TPA: hypothetical protein VKD66_14415, partial [Streptosporangiaceae bacterium]|nr:hypothetical protein [Streptosporangiaceae bacterium]